MPLERLIHAKLDLENFDWAASLNTWGQLTLIRLPLVLSIVYLKPNKEERKVGVCSLSSIKFSSTQLI